MEPIVFTIRCKKRVGEIEVEYTVQRHMPQEMFYSTNFQGNLVEFINKEMEESLNRVTKENT